MAPKVGGNETKVDPCDNQGGKGNASTEHLRNAFISGAEVGAGLQRQEQQKESEAEPGLWSKLYTGFVTGTQSQLVSTAVTFAEALATGFVRTQFGPMTEKNGPLAPARQMMRRVCGL